MDNSLRKLRKEAGYSSAAKFAEEVGIPAPTYARYEQAEDGPDTSMPLKNAWLIADKLGCSIDHIVGREHIDPDQMRGEVQKAYDALTDAGKQRIDEYFGFVEFLEKQEIEHLKRETEAYIMQYTQGLESLFLRSLGEKPVDEELFSSKAKMRAAFRKFVVATQEERLDERIGHLYAEAQYKIRKPAGLVEEGEGEKGPYISFRASDDPETEATIAERIEVVFEAMKEAEQEDIEEVTEKVMSAYDKMHPYRPSRFGNGESTYAFISFDND